MTDYTDSISPPLRHSPPLGFRSFRPPSLGTRTPGNWTRSPRSWAGGPTPPRTRAKLETWWRTWPDAVPGIELEMAGLVVLDLDRHPDAPDGVQAFKRLRAGRIINPPITLTATNGLHLVFRQPKGKPFGNGRGNLPPGIDVRGAGGWIVAPGATTPWGSWRSAPNAPALTDAYAKDTIPILPAWLATIIRPPVITIRSPWYTTITTRMPGNREEAYAAAALAGQAADLAGMAQNRGRNHALNAGAFRLAQMAARGWIGRSEIENRLFQASEANLLVSDDGAHSVRATIQSGFTAGLQKPHPDLPERE